MRLLSSFVLALLFITVVRAQQPVKVPVGKQPLAIFAVQGKIHVFCGRVDQNFNGEQDAEDTPPSWWILDPSSETVEQNIELPWTALGFPARLAIDSINNKVYLPAGDSILIYDLASQQKTGAIGTGEAIRSVSIDIPSQTLFFCVSGFQTTSTVYMHNLTTGARQSVFATDTIAYLQTALPVRLRNGDSVLVLLFEGTFGQTDSRLVLLFEDHATILPIGGLGNHIAAFGDTVIVTMNGSHQIHLVDLRTESIVQTIATGTDGYNGPRESLLWDHYIVTSTYNSDVRFFDLSSGELRYTLDPQGKPEGFAIANGKLWIANAFIAGSYDPDSTISILPLPTTGISPSHRETLAPLPVRISFDPATNRVRFSADVPLHIQQIRINTLEGRTLLLQSDVALFPSGREFTLPPTASTTVYCSVQMKDRSFTLALPLIR